MKKIEKEKEELDMQEVEKKYKAVLTAELREEYGISKMVPSDNPMHPPSPCNSNIAFSTIKMELLNSNDLANSMKKVVQQKGTLMVLAQIPHPRKKGASATEFKTLMTPNKPKTSLKSKFALPKLTSHSKD